MRERLRQPEDRACGLLGDRERMDVSEPQPKGDPERFKERLKKIAKHKPVEKAE